MYLLWKRNSLGSILISQDGIFEFVNFLCPKPFKCTQVSLSSAENTLFLVITMPRDSDSVAMESLEAKLRDSFGPSGLSVRVSWVELAEKSSFVDNDEIATLAKKPVVWAILFALFALLVREGVGTLLWSLFWGVAFYAGVLFFKSETGAALVQKLRSLAGR
jgi:hypothetical protein